MKAISLFLALFFCINAYSSDLVQEINKQASELVDNNYSAKTDDEILYEFYSKKILELDLNILKENPELIFRKAHAWFQLLDYESFSSQKFMNQLSEIRNDFQFVMDHTEKETQMFKASSLKNKLINWILESSPTTIEELFDIINAFTAKILSQWATNSFATGQKLREEVFFNIQMDSDIKNSFYDFLLLSGDTDLALGYIKPDEITVLGIVPGEDQKARLLCRIVFTKLKNGFHHCIYTFELEL